MKLTRRGKREVMADGKVEGEEIKKVMVRGRERYERRKTKGEKGREGG